MTNGGIIDRIIVFISNCRILNVVAITIGVVVFVSVPIVYISAYFFHQKYTIFLFILSIIIPAAVTPVTVLILSAFSKHLRYYQKILQEEIDKNKKMDIMLFEQARFVLMGEMMANISHQWKQPLNNMGLAIVATRLSAHSKEELERNFDIMEDNINYLSNTINDFMSFFDKKTPIERKNIQNIIDEIKSIIQVQIENSGIMLNIDIDPRLKSLEMTSAISQVLLNLLNNAKDAIDNSVENKEITLYFKLLEDGFEITCCDNGRGIKSHIAQKIFDPYFTTKEKKQGTGIGLYMSKQIINKVFDGTIILDKNNKYTCFRIKIPCSKNCNLRGLG